MTPRRHALAPEQLAEAAGRALDNSVALVEEADVLLAHNHHPRALALGALAAEEFGKAMAAFGALRLEPADDDGWRKFWRRIHDHEPKFRNFAVITEGLMAVEDQEEFVRTLEDYVGTARPSLA